MHQPKLRTPLSVLVLGFIIAISMFFRDELPIAQSQTPPYLTPQTATPSPTTTPTATRVGPNSTPTPFGSAPTPVAVTPTRISTPTQTMIPASPTPALPECRPGSTVFVSGKAPPKAALLLLFDERPVGGGTAREDGSFALPLKVGQEKPGVHDISVRIRGPMRAVLQKQCMVPSQ